MLHCLTIIINLFGWLALGNISFMIRTLLNVCGDRIGSVLLIAKWTMATESELDNSRYMCYTGPSANENYGGFTSWLLRHSIEQVERFRSKVYSAAGQLPQHLKLRE